MEALQVYVSQSGPTAVLHLVGPITAKHVSVLRQVLYRVESQKGSLHCLLDLSEAHGIDGYGLSLLVGLLARRRAVGGQVVLFGVRPDLRTAFESTFCDVLIPIRPTLASAMEVLPA